MENDAPWASGGYAGGGGRFRTLGIVCRDCPVCIKIVNFFFLLLLFPLPKIANRWEAGASRGENLARSSRVPASDRAPRLSLSRTHIGLQQPSLCLIPFHGGKDATDTNHLRADICAFLDHSPFETQKMAMDPCSRKAHRCTNLCAHLEGGCGFPKRNPWLRTFYCGIKNSTAKSWRVPFIEQLGASHKAKHLVKAWTQVEVLCLLPGTQQGLSQLQFSC